MNYVYAFKNLLFERILIVESLNISSLPLKKPFKTCFWEIYNNKISLKKHKKLHVNNVFNFYKLSTSV